MRLMCAVSAGVAMEKFSHSSSPRAKTSTRILTRVIMLSPRTCMCLLDTDDRFYHRHRRWQSQPTTTNSSSNNKSFIISRDSGTPSVAWKDVSTLRSVHEGLRCTCTPDSSLFPAVMGRYSLALKNHGTIRRIRRKPVCSSPL